MSHSRYKLNPQQNAVPIVPQLKKAERTQSPNPMATSLLRLLSPVNPTRQSLILRHPPLTPLNISFSAHRSHWRHGMRSVVATSASSPGGTSAVDSQEIATSLEDVWVFDLNGKEVSITDIWRERKAVVTFARHFGCVLCRKRADLLASRKDEMDAAGVALVLIGPGSVDQAKTFYEQTKFPGEIYADPNHSSYNALKFAYGILTTFTPSAGMKIIQSYMEGYRQDWKLSSEKDTMTKGGWQQGGLLVAGPGLNNIIYIHKDKEAGDDPDMKDVLKACCS